MVATEIKDFIPQSSKLFCERCYDFGRNITKHCDIFSHSMVLTWTMDGFFREKRHQWFEHNWIKETMDGQTFWSDHRDGNPSAVFCKEQILSADSADVDGKHGVLTTTLHDLKELHHIT